MVLDFTNHKATLYDEGDNRLSATSLPQIGKALAGILTHAQATENRIVRVSEVIVTQNQLLKIAEGVRPDVQWEVSKVPASAVLNGGLEQVKAGDFSMPAIMKVLAGTVGAGDVYGAAYDETDNELLGIEELGEEGLKSLVAKSLA